MSTGVGCVNGDQQDKGDAATDDGDPTDEFDGEPWTMRAKRPLTVGVIAWRVPRCISYGVTSVLTFAGEAANVTRGRLGAAAVVTTTGERAPPGETG
eukprot:CAMPEP_0115590526 /NCGR_PEP_ID=MMETSP0272-20121206/9809_1 /TAXON_ID=71861 /ORGANISM="Scrippsiella trochoidea, Strain CCMP3099" /LENGTH=96 /DNA_ID=CAMNT_0003025723 /DNA_START=437 /DNA_END=724 /DNA_ORIENTATION=+